MADNLDNTRITEGSVETNSFEDAVIAAVNLGGDADTIGAMTGGLAGTFYGFNAIPERWLDVLERKDELNEVASRLSDLHQKGDPF